MLGLRLQVHSPRAAEPDRRHEPLARRSSRAPFHPARVDARSRGVRRTEGAVGSAAGVPATAAGAGTGTGTGTRATATDAGARGRQADESDGEEAGEGVAETDRSRTVTHGRGPHESAHDRRDGAAARGPGPGPAQCRGDSAIAGPGA